MSLLPAKVNRGHNSRSEDRHRTQMSLLPAKVNRGHNSRSEHRHRTQMSLLPAKVNRAITLDLNTDLPTLMILA
jgi:hypothetical protein